MSLINDQAGNTKSVTKQLPGASSATTVAMLGHLPFGPINGATFGNGVTESWVFDQAYRPHNITDALSGTSLQNLTYGYDAANNVKAITDAVNAANSQNLGYDSINRLISASGGYGTFGWKYDNVGNRLEQTQGTTTTTYGYTPGTNRLLTISTSTMTAHMRSLPSRDPSTKAGAYFWANAPPPWLPPVTPGQTAPLSHPASPRLSGLIGWPILLTGFAGIFTLRKRLRIHRLLTGLSLAAILSGSATLFTGCIGASSIRPVTDPASPLTVTGVVHGGQQPISGAAIQLYAVGATGDSSSATPLLKSTVLTSSSGSFSITSDYTCPATTTEVYLVATGGNSGLASGANNSAIALMAALGPCGSVSGLPYVSVNELTTVGSLAALYPYMSSVSSLGFVETSQLTAAFAAVNAYTNVTTGSVPGPSLPSGYYAASIEIQTLGDAVAACINSSGTVTATSPCGMLFALATPPGGSAPADTIGAMLNILKNPTLNVAGILGLANPAAPFQPTLTSPPSSWSLQIVRSFRCRQRRSSPLPLEHTRAL